MLESPAQQQSREMKAKEGWRMELREFSDTTSLDVPGRDNSGSRLSPVIN